MLTLLLIFVAEIFCNKERKDLYCGGIVIVYTVLKCNFYLTILLCSIKENAF